MINYVWIWNTTRWRSRFVNMMCFLLSSLNFNIDTTDYQPPTSVISTEIHFCNFLPRFPSNYPINLRNDTIWATHCEASSVQLRRCKLRSWRRPATVEAAEDRLVLHAGRPAGRRTRPRPSLGSTGLFRTGVPARRLSVYRYVIFPLPFSPHFHPIFVNFIKIP